jgi:hypothetical protein
MKVSGRKYPVVWRVMAGAYSRNLLKRIQQSGLDIAIYEDEFENEPGRFGYTAEINGKPVVTPHDDVAYFESADAAEKGAYDDIQKTLPNDTYFIPGPYV